MKTLLFTTIAAISLTAISSAQIFSCSGTPCDTNKSAGQFGYVMTSFNTSSKEYKMNATCGQSSNGSVTDGFWLAVGPGRTLEGPADKLAMMNLDARDTSDIKLTVDGFNIVSGDSSDHNGGGVNGARARQLCHCWPHLPPT